MHSLARAACSAYDREYNLLNLGMQGVSPTWRGVLFANHPLWDPGTMTRKNKIVGGIAGTFVLLIAILVIVILTFDYNRLKPTINDKATEALGRPFSINGDLSVRWARDPDTTGWRGWVPWPHVDARDIAIGNPDWAKARQFATLERARFSISPLPLIAHQVVIRQIQLTKPSADLERLEDGRATWVFTMKDTGEPSSWVMDIGEIGFDQGRVGFVDAILKADLEVKIDPLGKPIPFVEIAGETAAADARAVSRRDLRDYVFGWAVKGKYNAQALKGEGKIGGMLTLRDDDVPFPLQADVTVGDTRAAVIGTFMDPMHLGKLDVKLKLSGSSMAKLYPLTGVALPDTPPYSTDGRLIAQVSRPEGAIFDYKNFNGSVGKSDIHGDLNFTKAQPRPKLSGQLTSKLLRLEDLGPLIGVQSGGAKAPDDSAKKQPADKALPVQEFRTDRWADMDADVKLDAKQIVHSSKLPLSNLDVHAILDAGKLTLNPLNFGMAGGRITTNVELDGSKPTLQGRAKVGARKLRLKQLFADADAMQKSLGEMNGDIALSGTGNSISTLLASSNGEAKILVNDGVISRSLMEIAGLNVGNYVVSKLFGDKEVAINCAASDVQIKDGLATPAIFVFDTENALINVTGNANFKNEALDLDIAPKSKGYRIFSLRSPLYVKGTFKDPKPGVQVVPLAARAAGMVALGVIAAPAVGLLALIAPSAGDEQNTCATMLKEMQGAPKAPPPKAR